MRRRELLTSGAGYVPHSDEYFTIEALEEVKIHWNQTRGMSCGEPVDNVIYSSLDGVSWSSHYPNWNSSSHDATYVIRTINAGQKLYFKAQHDTYHETSGCNYDYFCIKGRCNVYGNILSLIYSDNFTSYNVLPDASQNFYYFFVSSDIVDASNLVLPLNVTYNCYYGFFSQNKYLTKPPKLPATELASYCYSSMFNGCTSLTTLPKLPATIMKTRCYESMFSGCTSLTEIPNNYLPATELESRCYGYMFYGCTSLTTVPDLPATTLKGEAYYYMFGSCTSLTTLPRLSATTFYGYDYAGMFRYCTSLTTVPSDYLPVTTLASGCYNEMFIGCSNLTTPPDLPATALVSNCYTDMFKNCTKLNYIKAMFTTKPSDTYTKDWVNGVAASGTFVKNRAASWSVTGTNGIPSGWTVQTASS